MSIGSLWATVLAIQKYHQTLLIVVSKQQYHDLDFYAEEMSMCL